MKTLIIMRGIPGSGKSTKAQELAAGGQVFASDDFWGQDYDHDSSRLAEAHKWNQDRVAAAMIQDISPVVVDSTNTMFWHMRPYVEMALEHEYDIQFEEADTPWKFDAEELALRNTHGVSLELIEQFIKQWEPNPTVEDVMNSFNPNEVREATEEENQAFAAEIREKISNWEPDIWFDGKPATMKQMEQLDAGWTLDEIMAGRREL